MSAGDFVKTLCKFFIYKSPPRVGNFFPLPNEIFNMDLCAGEIALYCYLMRMEDRKTYSCYPSFKTIGKALKMSRNTVMKYVHSLEEKGLITTEHTSVITSAGIKRNGTVKIHISEISFLVVGSTSVSLTAYLLNELISYSFSY